MGGTQYERQKEIRGGVLKLTGGRKPQIESGATRIIWISAFPFGLLAGRYKCKGDRVVLLRIEEKLTTKRYGKLDLLY